MAVLSDVEAQYQNGTQKVPKALILPKFAVDDEDGKQRKDRALSDTFRWKELSVFIGAHRHIN